MLTLVTLVLKFQVSSEHPTIFFNPLGLLLLPAVQDDDAKDDEPDGLHAGKVVVVSCLLLSSVIRIHPESGSESIWIRIILSYPDLAVDLYRNFLHKSS